MVQVGAFEFLPSQYWRTGQFLIIYRDNEYIVSGYRYGYLYVLF